MVTVQEELNRLKVSVEQNKNDEREKLRESLSKLKNEFTYSLEKLDTTVKECDRRRHDQGNHINNQIGLLGKRLSESETNIRVLEASHINILEVVRSNTNAMKSLSDEFRKLSTRINAVIWVVITIGSLVTFFSTIAKNFRDLGLF